MYLHQHQKHRRHEGWQWPASVLCTCDCSRWRRLEVWWREQSIWPFSHYCSNRSCVNRDVKEGRRQTLPIQRRSKQPFHVCWLRSNAPRSSTSGAPNVATTSSGTYSSHAAAAGGSPTLSNSAPVSHKSDAAKATGSASPSQSVKANSVARDISSGAIAGIMFAVGLTSILVTLVV